MTSFDLYRHMNDPRLAAIADRLRQEIPPLPTAEDLKKVDGLGRTGRYRRRRAGRHPDPLPGSHPNRFEREAYIDSVLAGVAAEG